MFRWHGAGGWGWLFMSVFTLAFWGLVELRCANEILIAASAFSVCYCTRRKAARCTALRSGPPGAKGQRPAGDEHPQRPGVVEPRTQQSRCRSVTSRSPARPTMQAVEGISHVDRHVDVVLAK